MNEKGFVAKTLGYSIHIYTVNCSDVHPGIPSVTRRRDPQVRICCCFRPTPMEKMAVTYDVI